MSIFGGNYLPFKWQNKDSPNQKIVVISVSYKIEGSSMIDKLLLKSIIFFYIFI